MTDVVLYSMATCPFCLKVLAYMKKNNIEVVVKDTLLNQAYRQELLEIGGKTQVPCLVIDGKALYESEDIIVWFKEHSQELKQV